jgi:thiamine kinase-like enzyme
MASSAAEVEGIRVLAECLIGTPADFIAPVRGGRNSRVFRVGAGDRLFALKCYPAGAEDARDRLGTEVDALRLMQQLGFANVPRIVAVSAERNCALLTWLDGDAVVAVDDNDIDAAARFLAALHAARASARATFDRQAAECCLSGRELVEQISRRLNALCTQCRSDADLMYFLLKTFAPALERHVAEATRMMAAAGLDFSIPLPQEEQALAPSDFGFHNSLRRRDRTLVFVDFEYFGWDDPVKLTADMLHHPGTALTSGQRDRFRDTAIAIYGDDVNFAPRLDALGVLFALRWVLIILNEFLPDVWRIRVAAGETESWGNAKSRQLARAMNMFATLAPAPETIGHG